MKAHPSTEILNNKLGSILASSTMRELDMTHLPDLPREVFKLIFWGARREQAAGQIQHAYYASCDRRAKKLEALADYMLTFAAMDDYVSLQAVVWAFPDGHMEVDLDVRTASPHPPVRLVSMLDDTDPDDDEYGRCNVASLEGDSTRGSIDIFYRVKGIYKSVHRLSYERQLDNTGGLRRVHLTSRGMSGYSSFGSS
jgi:hypothetical protein